MQPSGSCQSSRGSSGGQAAPEARVVLSGDVQAEEVIGTHLEVDGSLNLKRRARLSTVTVFGPITAPGAKITGCTIEATGIQKLGAIQPDEQGEASRIVLGKTPTVLLQQLEEMVTKLEAHRGRQKELAWQRSQLQGVVSDSLKHADREALMELDYEIDNVDEAINQLQAKHETLEAQVRSRQQAALAVSFSIGAGTTLVFGDGGHHYRTTREISGPLATMLDSAQRPVIAINGTQPQLLAGVQGFERINAWP